MTALLDPDPDPATPRAAESHQRWAVATTAAAVKTHAADRRPAPPVRSRRPREVVQEVSGLLRAHLAVRLTRSEAATGAGIAPDRRSFTGPLRILRRARPRCQRGVAHPDRLPFGGRGC